MSIFHPRIFASPYGYTVIFIIECNTIVFTFSDFVYAFYVFVYITHWVDVIYFHVNQQATFKSLTFFSPSVCFTFTDELKIQLILSCILDWRKMTLCNHFASRLCIIFKLSYGICCGRKKKINLEDNLFCPFHFLGYVCFLLERIQTILAFSMKFLVSLLKSPNSIILSA